VHGHRIALVVSATFAARSVAQQAPKKDEKKRSKQEQTENRDGRQAE
jgi:hypothetical protein